MGGDEEKKRLLLQEEVVEEDETRKPLVAGGEIAWDGHNNVHRAKSTGSRAAVMGACLTAVAVATLLVIMTLHNVCGQRHHHIVPSSQLAEPSNVSAITVDDGRYDHATVDVAAAVVDEEEVGEGDNASAAYKPGYKNGTPVVWRRESATASANATSTTTTSSATATGTVLVDFQVHQPVLTPEGATLDNGKSNGEAGDVQDACQVVLMDHIFAYSYGEPYIGGLPPYASSPDC